MKKHQNYVAVMVLLALLVVSVIACTSTEEAATVEEAPAEEAVEEAAPAEEVTEEEVADADQLVPNEEYVIGVSLMTRTHTFYKMMEEALLDEADKLGVELIVMSAENDTNVQMNQIQDFITQGVDAILFTPFNTEDITPITDLAGEQNIPVFTQDGTAEGDYISSVSTDNYTGGQLAGEYAADFLGGEGKVAVVCSRIGEAVIDREEGFTSVLEGTDIEVLAITECNVDQAIAADQTADLIISYPDLDLIFACGDPFALGALSSINAADEDIYVIGYDGLPEGIAEIQKGGLFLASIAQNPDKISRTSLDDIVKYLNGEEVERDIWIEPYVIDSTNADQYATE